MLLLPVPCRAGCRSARRVPREAGDDRPQREPESRLLLLSKPMDTKTARRRSVGERARDAQFNLGSGGGPTPDVQSGADVFGTLAHSAQAEMSCPPFFNDRGRKTLSIVANEQAEQPRHVGDFRLDVMSPRVRECITQRFAGYAIHLVPYNRMQLPRRAFH